MNMKQKREFSKTLLIQESILIWIMTISFIALAFICVFKGYLGTLPWLGAMVSLPWAAYGVSAGFYYNKSKAEKTVGGIVYDSAMLENKQKIEEYVKENQGIDVKTVNIDYGI